MTAVQVGLDPKARGGVFKDPRWSEPADHQVGVVAFYYPGTEEVWDALCGGGFLGNFFEMGKDALRVQAPCEPGRWHCFRNAEAAFQALKFWRMADEFSGLSGKDAFTKKKLLKGREDFTYGGYGSNWKGMQAILHAKFQKGTLWADALIKTGDAFLFEHNAVSGRDKVWSDNSDGEGTNWLGLQLMLLRDELTGKSAWTSFIATSINLESGKPLTEDWQRAVRSAHSTLMEELARLPEDFGSRTRGETYAKPADSGSDALRALRKSMGMAEAAPAAQNTADGSAEADAASADAGAADSAVAAAALGVVRGASAALPAAQPWRPTPLETVDAPTVPAGAAAAVASTAGAQPLDPVNAVVGLGATDPQAVALAAEPVLHVRVQGPGGIEVQLSVRAGTNLRVLMAAACSRLGLQEPHTSFRHRGRDVLPLHTAEVLGLQDGDVLVADGPAVAREPAKQRAKMPRAKRPLPQWSMDLEWSCPSCGAEYPAASEVVVAEPLMSCMRCGWQGYPELQKRSASHGHAADSRTLPAENSTGRTVNTVASSGYVLEKDFEGQHVEAPLGGLLALVSQVQRERLFAGFLCYLCFCVCFVVVVTLGRPLGRFFEVQSALHQQLILREVPASASAGMTFQDVSDWRDFWAWVDGVLVEEVFTERHPLLGDAPPTNHSRFAIGRYNRVLTAVRFQQVRARPTLPDCPRLSDGSHPTPLQMACTTEEPFGHMESCDTPVDSHQLSRPCWGYFSAGYQDLDYPSAIQKETVAVTPPAQDLLCLQSCDAYHSRGLRTAEQWLSFGRSDILAWVADFARLHARAEDALAACRSACDASGSTFQSGLTHTDGDCGSSVGKPAHLLIADDIGCFGDVVDLPLEPSLARRRVAAMKRERWTNEGTRSLAIDINTYNPNYDVATAVRIVVRAHPGGRLSPSVEMWSCRFRLYGSGVDTFRLLLEVLFSLWIVYYILVELSEVYVQRWAYFKEAWNYVELANLSVYAYTTTSWFIYINSTYTELEAFKSPSPNAYRDLYTIATGFNSITLASFNLIYGFIRFTKYFRMSLKFKMLWDTLAHAMERVLPLMLIYGVLLMGFAWSGHWLFGHRVEGFESLPAAVMTLLVSVKDGIAHKDIQDASPGAAVSWHLAWYVCSSLVFMSLLLTVVINSFSQVKRQAEHNDRIECEALEKSTKLPSLLLTWLRENSPVGLCRAGWSDKLSKEAQDNIVELTESLFEVDLEALWARLLQGVVEDEIVVDAAELKFLFGGSQRKARLFVNRICNLAQLPHVAAGKPATIVDATSEVRSSVEGLAAEISCCYKDLEARYPTIVPFLRSKKTLHDARFEEPSGAPALASNAVEPEEVGGLVAEERGGARGGERSDDVSSSGAKPPARGELRLAAAALDFKRQQRREAQHERVPTDGADNSTTAVAMWTDDELAHGRPAIANFIEAVPLKRR